MTSIFEQHFYFLLSVKYFIPHDLEGTKITIEQIYHKVNFEGQKLDEYSQSLQEAYVVYVRFLSLKELLCSTP